ncbi:MAG: Asp-tRNA(Asn)/Glu-tRNA(Gln) amidotransferase subunit GatC [Patescibacteria group bacterium]|nr:Asp-tRNA(Asn)/Glu-tRNA(Gln) amidotransferase subunit GatC [Patescibacteria group bacterium]
MRQPKSDLQNSQNIEHVAKLANLPLSNAELAIYSEQLDKIIDYINQLNQVDTKSVEPTFSVREITNVFQTGEQNQSLTATEALQNAPVHKDNFFVTKGIFED